jgi:hypothetical protein
MSESRTCPSPSWGARGEPSLRQGEMLSQGEDQVQVHTPMIHYGVPRVCSKRARDLIDPLLTDRPVPAQKDNLGGTSSRDTALPVERVF